MAIKTITQYLDCLEIKGIFPDDYQASLEVPYSNGNLIMRFLVTKMIDENADLAGYLFTPQIFQGKNTSAVGSDVTIVCNSATSTQWTIGGLSTNSTVITPEISSDMGINLEPDTWVDLHPSLAFGKEIPQRGKVYNFRGNIDIGYSVTATINDNPVTLNYTINFDFSSTLTSEVLETHIYNPLYAQPYNSSVDAAETELDFSMQFSGEQLNTYETEIFNSETNNRVYPQESAGANPISLEETLYNQEQLNFKVPEGIYDTHNLLNNNKYKWHNILSRYSNDDSAGNLVDNNKFLFYRQSNPLNDYTQLEYVTRPNITPPTIDYVNWLQLNYTPKATTKIRIKFSNAQTGFYVVGGGISDILTTTNWGLYRINSNFYFAQRNTAQTLIPPSTSAWGSGEVALISAPQLYQDNKIYDLTIGNNFIWDNIEQKYIASWTPTRSEYFNGYTNFVNLCRAGGNYYSIQIWEDGNYGMPLSDADNLKYNFTPVKRNSDNHVGMYDTINASFYQNDKSGGYNASLLSAGTEIGALGDEKLQIGQFVKLSPILMVVGKAVRGVDISLPSKVTDGYIIKTKFYLYNFQGSENYYRVFSIPIKYTKTGSTTIYTKNLELYCRYLEDADSEHQFRFYLNGTAIGSNIANEAFANRILQTALSNDIYYDLDINITFNESYQLSISGKLGYYSNGDLIGQNNITLSNVSIDTNINQILPVEESNLMSSYNPSETSNSTWGYLFYYYDMLSNMGETLISLYPYLNTSTSQANIYAENLQTFFEYKSTQKLGGSAKQQTTAYQQYPKFETLDYGFYTYNKPVLNYIINESEIADITTLQTVTSPEISLQVEYSQAQNIGIKYYNFTFKDEEGNLIQQTENIYSNDINFEYSGLINGEQYKLSLFLVTQQGQELSQDIDILASYTLTPYSVPLIVSAFPINSLGAVLITDFSKYYQTAVYLFDRIILYRQEQGKNYYEKIQDKIYDNSTEGSEEGWFNSGELSFIDFEAANSTTYSYKILGINPYGEYINLANITQGVETPITASTSWESFKLYTLNNNIGANTNSYTIPMNFVSYLSTSTTNNKITLNQNTLTFSYSSTSADADEIWQKAEEGDILLLGRDIIQYPNIHTSNTKAFRILSKDIGSTQSGNSYNHQVTLQVVSPWEAELQNFVYTYNTSDSFGFQLIKSTNNLVWTFYLNCKEGSLTLKQDKTIFNSFSKYPKYSIGKNNYHSGSFSALLGNYNGIYYEDNIEIVEKWKEFLEKVEVCLYKNLKGEVMIVVIESDSTREYMNEYANLYNNNGEINTYPTSISFNYVEVDEIRKLQGTVQVLPEEA